MKLKVCGMKYKENISQVAGLQPDYMGFLFYPASKRYVGDEFKMPELSPFVKKVGVFVNENEDKILRTAKKHKLDFVQLHGDESAEFCNSISKHIKVIKAFGLDERFDFNSLESYKTSCTYFLFDTKSSGYGGTGKTFNWKILEKYDNEIPFFLSGGIDDNSLVELKNYKNLNIHALDINSKFEAEPGLKDIEKIIKFKSNLSVLAP